MEVGSRRSRVRQRSERALVLACTAALSLGLAACTAVVDEPESLPPGEQAPADEPSQAPWSAVKLSPVERVAPPPALASGAVVRGEFPPPIVRYRVAPASVGVLPQTGPVGLYAEVDGEWRAVGVGEAVYAGTQVIPIWLEPRRYVAALEARPLAPGTPAGAALRRVVSGGDAGAPELDIGGAVGVRVGDLYEVIAAGAGEGRALLRVTAVEEERVRASVESGGVADGAWARQIERLPVINPGWIDSAPIEVGTQRWLAGLLAKEGPDGALLELRQRVDMGVAEDRLLLVAMLTAQRRWGEAESLATEALAEARERGDRSAELAALLVAVRLDLELGDYDAAAVGLGEARKLGPGRGPPAAIERLQADLHYLRWDLGGAAKLLEERALPLLAEVGDLRAVAGVHSAIAEIERHQGAFDRAARRLEEEVLPRLGEDDDRAHRARAYDQLADVEAMRGPPARALALRRGEELPLYAALGEPWGEAQAQRKIARLEQARGKNREAEAAYEAAERAVEVSGDRREALRLKLWRAEFVYERSRFREAAEIETAMIRGYARLGDPRGYAIHLAGKAELEALLGEIGRSMRAIKREALPLIEALGDGIGRDEIRGSLAAVYSERGMESEALKIRRDELLPSYKRLADPVEEAFMQVFIADSYISLGKLDEAERRIKRHAQPALGALGEVRLSALCLGRLGEILSLRGDFKGAAKLYEKERAVYERIGEALGVVAADQRLSYQLARQGDHDAAISLLEKTVIPGLRRMGAVGFRASAERDLGIFYIERGDFDHAETILRAEALPAFESLGDRGGAADVQALIGDIYVARGEYAKALELYEDELLPTYKTVGDIRGQAMTLGRIASCHFTQGAMTEALKLFREALKIYESMGDAYSTARCYADIAGVYEVQGHYEPALELYRERVLPVYERGEDLISVTITKNEMADLYFWLGDAERAIAIREAGNEVFRKAKLEYPLMNSRWMLAIYLYQRKAPGDRERARRLADQALAVATRLRIPDEARLRDFVDSMQPQ